MLARASVAMRSQTARRWYGPSSGHQWRAVGRCSAVVLVYNLFSSGAGWFSRWRYWVQLFTHSAFYQVCTAGLGRMNARLFQTWGVTTQRWPGHGGAAQVAAPSSSTAHWLPTGEYWLCISFSLLHCSYCLPVTS